MRNTAMATLGKARLMLSNVRTLEQAIEVRNRASAVAAYSRAKGANETHLIALEIKLRAEHKAGQFLKGMEKRQGSFAHRSHDVTDVPPKLKDLGIDKMESVRWQKIASIPRTSLRNILPIQQNGRRRQCCRPPIPT